MSSSSIDDRDHEPPRRRFDERRCRLRLPAIAIEQFVDLQAGNRLLGYRPSVVGSVIMAESSSNSTRMPPAPMVSTGPATGSRSAPTISSATGLRCHLLDEIAVGDAGHGVCRVEHLGLGLEVELDGAGFGLVGDAEPLSATGKPSVCGGLGSFLWRVAALSPIGNRQAEASASSALASHAR